MDLWICVDLWICEVVDLFCGSILWICVIYSVDLCDSGGSGLCDPIYIILWSV